MPGLLPAAEHPPQAVGVSVQDAAFLCARQVLMRLPPQLLVRLLSGLTTLVASILWKIIVANFKSKLLVPIFQQRHELKK